MDKNDHYMDSNLERQLISNSPRYWMPIVEPSTMPSSTSGMAGTSLPRPTVSACMIWISCQLTGIFILYFVRVDLVESKCSLFKKSRTGGEGIKTSVRYHALSVNIYTHRRSSENFF